MHDNAPSNFAKLFPTLSKPVFKDINHQMLHLGIKLDIQAKMISGKEFKNPASNVSSNSRKDIKINARRGISFMKYEASHVMKQ